MKQAIFQNEANQSASPSILASSLRSDTVDILHYTISLDITDFTTDTIRGNTTVRFAPRINNVNSISLDLLKMKVDSVTLNGVASTHSYNDTLLITPFPHTFNIGDTAVLTVFYHGKPQSDVSGFGGFYFQGTFAYNLGVGTSVNPHNFGRVWYPCFDNFVERATYTFNITTSAGKIAYCNGLLSKDITLLSGNRMRTWDMNKTIPSYLANVAVAPFAELDFTFPSLTGPRNVVIAAVPADTANVRSSFVHLPNAFSIFENHYGPYSWDKVGYSLVPFNYGAMEHATNISYPRAAANGTTFYESGLMAHELSHHWFGDLATCSSEQDMWLNEGWATYSQYLFLENMYGYSAYLAQVVPYHEMALHYANWKEGGYLALSAIPHAYTYGDHVYKKGADVAHTLRSYMGDSLFFAGLKYHLSHRQYKAASSTDFMNDLIAGTGLGNLNDFFNGWVFNPGWPHFSVDSFTATPSGGNWIVQVFVRQKLTGAPSYFNQVPLQLTFKDSSWNTITREIIVSGKNSAFTFTLPILPVYAGLNLDEKISHAVTSDNQVLKTNASVFGTTQKGRMTLTPLNANISTDSAWIRIAHNYTAPDPFKAGGQAYVLSPNRYWTVDGIFPPGFQASASLEYDGRSLTTGGAGCLDNNFLFATNLEDSIVLLYRRGAGDDWHSENNISKNMGSPTDKFGTITINNLRKGEYVLALKGFYTDVKEIVPGNMNAKIFPNPSASLFYVELAPFTGNISVNVTDLQGRLIFSELAYSERFSIQAGTWTNGVYILTLSKDGKYYSHSRLVVTK